MDAHQKKATAVAVVASIIAFLLIVYALRLTVFGSIIIAACWLLLAFLFLKVNRWMRPYLNGKEYPNNDWYRKHFDRNYDILILGDDISRSQIPEEYLQNKKVFDCSLSDQNLYVDFLVLKNTFSILKPQGVVYIPLRKVSIKYINDKFYDERRYYWALSPYVFNSSSVSCALKKVYTRIPGLLFRFKDLLYLLRRVFVPNYDALKILKRIEKETTWLENTPDKVKNDLKINQKHLIDEMQSFCDERDIKLKIIDV